MLLSVTLTRTWKQTILSVENKFYKISLEQNLKNHENIKIKIKIHNVDFFPLLVTTRKTNDNPIVYPS